MVSGLSMTSRPVESTIDSPAMLASNSITVPSGASAIACRSEPAPASSTFVTMTTGASSNWGRPATCGARGVGLSLQAKAVAATMSGMERRIRRWGKVGSMETSGAVGDRV